MNLVRSTVVPVAFAIVAMACGGATEDVADAVDGAVDDVANEATEAVEEAAEEATDGVTDAAEEAAEDVTDAVAGGDVIAVSLVEWAVEAPTSLPSGDVTFTATNDGNFPHELAVIRGDSYEALPLLSNGEIDEAALGADVIDRTQRLASGESADLTVNLEPGNYVLVCNIAAGPNSHAAAGQVLSVTVEG